MLKRKRDPTFTTTEKMSLIKLIELHFAIVECKKSDAVSMKNKSEEWQKIATEFNSISGIQPRLPAVLKNCWENLKKRAKQEQTLRNLHFLGTGGGPPKNDIDNPVINRVLELVKTRVSGYNNLFDKDGIHILASDVTGTTKAKSTASGKDTSGAEIVVHTNDVDKSLTEEKLKTIIKAQIHAEEEHKLKMKILRLQEQKEEEILKQEKIKTRQEECKLQMIELNLLNSRSIYID